jgi:hypothetical protein
MGHFVSNPGTRSYLRFKVKRSSVLHIFDRPIAYEVLFTCVYELVVLKVQNVILALQARNSEEHYEAISLSLRFLVLQIYYSR